MGFAIILIVVAAAATMISLAFFNQAKAARGELSRVTSSRQALEDKIAFARKELALAKEDAAKKGKLLDEARDLARKKIRKDAIKANESLETEAIESSSEAERLKKALSAMEAQLLSFQADTDRAVAAAKKSAKEESDRQVENYREEIRKLHDQLGHRKEKATQQKQAIERSLAPLDVSTLSDEMVAEIARLMRKAEHSDKLQGVAHGKLQMAQERFAEMQKRYFAVCRELALVAGHSVEISDQEARNTAEMVLAASDAPVVEQAEASDTPSEEPAHNNGVTG